MQTLEIILSFIVVAVVSFILGVFVTAIHENANKDNKRL